MSQRKTQSANGRDKVPTEEIMRQRKRRRENGRGATEGTMIYLEPLVPDDTFEEAPFGDAAGGRLGHGTQRTVAVINSSADLGRGRDSKENNMKLDHWTQRIVINGGTYLERGRKRSENQRET